MKQILIGLLFLLPLSVFAGDITCQVQEIDGDTNYTQVHILQDSDDPHGAFQTVAMNFYTNYNAFVALSRGIIVIHLYETKTGAAFTAHGYGETNRYARLQYIMGGTSLTQGIVIDCAEQQL